VTSSPPCEPWERAASLLARAPKIAVLTGAGVSTDSGIPDFRGPQGLWTIDPRAQSLSDYDTYMADPEVRRTVWSMRRDHPARRAAPGAGHRALARLEEAGRLAALITQNIDGLHQRAGVPDERVLELHGTMHRVMCTRCGARRPMSEVLPRLDEDPDPPCDTCGGIQKADTVLFGEYLDSGVLHAAAEAAGDCALLLAVGSSLSVHPAAGLCDIAVDAGAHLVVVNGEPTPYDAKAEVTVHGPIGEVLPAMVDRAFGAESTLIRKPGDPGTR
jgi:NAD-dependent deacetylase